MPRPSTAWLLLAAAVAACEPTIAEVPGRPVVVAAATPIPLPSGVAPPVIVGTPYLEASPSSEASPAGEASPAPAPSPGASQVPGPPAGYPRVVRLAGRVFDDGGWPLPGAEVHVRALLAGVAYDRTATTGADGAFGLEDAPPGVALAVEAHKAGYTRRRQVASLPVRPDGARLDFGSAAGAPLRGEAAPFFLSSRPEIVAVSPAEDEALDPDDEVAFTLELSEPLDAANRDRLADALRLLPASDEALAPGQAGEAPDLREAGRREVDVDGGAADVAWAIGPGTRFPADGGETAEAGWRDATRLRFRVPAALLASARADVRYQLVVVTPPDGARIEDDTFHQLGTDAPGDLNGYPPPGHLLRRAFRAPDLVEAWKDADDRLDDLDPGAARWQATHRDAALVRLARDGRPPGLVGLEVGRLEADALIALAFDEPLVAFDGTAAGHRGPGLGATGDGALAFTFAAAASAAELADVALDGAPEALVDPRTGTALGADLFGRELAFVAEIAHGDRAVAPPGALVAEPDPRDARRVRLRLVGRPYWFRDAGAIKVRVAGFGDPAGNVRGAAQADAEVRTRPLPTPTPTPDP